MVTLSEKMHHAMSVAAFLPAEEQVQHQFTTLQIPDPQELQASKFPPVDNDSYPGSPAMGNLWSAPADRLAGLLS